MNKVLIPNEIMLAEVTRMINEGKSVIIMTKGASMYPFIRGEVDSVELFQIPDPRPGDIVLAQITRGVYVLHRIKSIDGDAVTLKGDGNLDSEEHCTIGDLCGRVRYIIHPDGSRVDCTTEKFERRSRRWRERSRFFRRYFLAIYRRVI